MKISCVHHDIPQDMTLAVEESRHHHQSVEDPNPVLGTPSLDLRLVRITNIRNWH
jgi:hypothetical protein